MPIATTALVMGGAALLGAGSQLIAGNKAARAQNNAATAQITEERRQYDTTRSDYAPWREAGAGALGRLAGMYGIGGPGTGPAPTTDTTGAYGGFFTSPGYEFRRDQGVQAIERSAAARGQLASGAAMKAVGRYADGLASSEYQQFGDRLAQIAGFGQNATAGTAQAGAQATQGITQAIGAAGNARASSYANIGSAINSGINNALYAYMRSGSGGKGGF